MKLAQLSMIAAAVLTCTVIVAQEPAPPAEEPAQGIATVDGVTVTREDLWWFMEQTRGGAILDDFILRRLIEAEAAEHQLSVGEPYVDEALTELRERYESEEEFDRWLRESGQTLKGLRIQLQQDLLIERLLEKRMGLTDEGIRRYYESHPGQFTEPSRIHLMDIVTLTIDDAFVARERLAAGEDFAAVAREMSQDPGAEQGGDRGWLTAEDILDQTLREAAFELEQGEVSDPVDAGDHYHVLFARQVEPGRLLDFEDARPQVIQRIREVRGISEDLFLALLKRRAEIEVTWPAHEDLNEYYADLRRIKIAVDDRLIDLPAEPRLLPNSNLIVPAQALFEAMGAGVSWNEQTGVLEVRRNGRTIRLVRGVDIMAIGGEELPMREPARVEGDVLMISPRAPVTALGGALFWNRADNTLYVSSYDEDAIAETEELP